MPAPTYEEPDYRRHPPGVRIRCADCHKVVFRDEEHATTRANDISVRGSTTMFPYLGKCGHWHVTRKKPKRYKARPIITIQPLKEDPE